MRRFFVTQGVLDKATATISGELFHHVSTVLRLDTGDRVLLAENNGKEAVALITSVGKDSLTVALEYLPARSPGMSPLSVTLYQGLPKGDKIDMILQKATELGADAIIPFRALRSVPKPDAGRIEKRLMRWERIVQEAARQSGRKSLPQLGFATGIAELILLREHSLKLLLWEGETDNSLKGVLSPLSRPKDVALIIGPEGGLTEEEAKLAIAAGYLPVTLGERILRTETAGIAALAILQYVWGDMG